MAMDDERQVNEQETTGPEREPLSIPPGESKSPGVGRKPEEKAQGTTEYAILVGVLVVIAIIAIIAFRDRVSELWNAISDGINSL